MKKYFSLLILSYLRFFARLQLSKNRQAVIIGITGSAGKTSTRLALAKVLGHHGRVKHSSHANSESGIPLNILDLKPINYSALDWLRLIILAPVMLAFNWRKFEYYIVEMGIDSALPPKNMEFLLTILRPHLAIVLNAGVAHGAGFDHLVIDRNPARRFEKIRLEIAKEKMKLAYAVDPAGAVIVNIDQKELRDLLPRVRARMITIGKRRSANLRFLKIHEGREFQLEFEYQTQKHKLVVPGLYEKSYSYTFGAAIAASAALGITPAKAVSSLALYHSPRGRLRLFRGIKDTNIIDSSYNASPDTMQNALKLFAKSAGSQHKLAIIGDMRELGAQTKLAHKNLADWIMGSADECILFGELTAKYTLPVLQSSHFPVRHFTKISELNAYVASVIRKGEWILVKGSQNKIFLERAVLPLLADPQDAANLARRGAFWERQRSLSA